MQKLSSAVVGGVRSFLPITEADVLVKHQVLLRKTELYFNTHRMLLYKVYLVRLLRIQNKTGIHIPINTCGKGLYLLHLGSRLINSRAKVGENCWMHINTSIVAGGTSDDVPVIGNNVVIGIGAVVLGNAVVPNNTAIGANAVVNKQFSGGNFALAGVPAKIVSNNGQSEWNKKNRKGVFAESCG